MSEGRFMVAAAQLTSTEDREENLATCRRLAAEAAERGASLVALPECYGFLPAREHNRFAIAEVIDDTDPGPILAATIEMARAHRIWVVGGGIAEVLPEQRGHEITRTYNTCVVISPDGELAARYRKIHLFDVDIPGKAQLRESDSTEPGCELVSVDTPLARLGLTICYDLRFPELYRKLAVDDGADILLVPAAFTAHTGEAHWHTLLRARAIENQCFVVAPAQVGRHNDRRHSYGHSLLIDPWGEVLAEKPEGTGLAVAEFDMQRLADVRARMPCRAHRVLG
jgi:deaminated glutathione amidase